MAEKQAAPPFRAASDDVWREVDQLRRDKAAAAPRLARLDKLELALAPFLREAKHVTSVFTEEEPGKQAAYFTQAEWRALIAALEGSDNG